MSGRFALRCFPAQRCDIAWVYSFAAEGNLLQKIVEGGLRSFRRGTRGNAFFRVSCSTVGDGAGEGVSAGGITPCSSLLGEDPGVEPFGELDGVTDAS